MLKNLISTSHFNSPKDLESIFAHTELLSSPYKNIDPIYVLRGKIVGLIFLEKSTRTKFSFDAAVKRLGGQTIDFVPENSSIGKGESLEDTIKVLSKYVDCLVIRHRDHNLIEKISKEIDIPIINAGSTEHPTQAITDLYTIRKETGKIHGTNFLFMGDLKYNRTVASLVNLLRIYKFVRVHLYSPEKLKLPKESFYDNIIYTEEKDLSILPKINVVYITRNQTELHPEITDEYFFGKNEVDMLDKNAIIMHPMPRNKELDQSVDSDTRAKYFKQVENGLYVRMAILKEMLDA